MAGIRRFFRQGYTVKRRGSQRPGQPMLTLVSDEELAARRHLRVPAESTASKPVGEE